MQGRVLNLFISHKERGRESKSEIDVDINGIIDDKFYAKDLSRTILIASLESYTLAKESGIDIDYGLLGENVIVDINPYSLTSGAKLSIGDLKLEITQNCTICNTLGKVDSRLPKLLKSDRGIFAKALNSATIKIGDSVSVEEE